MDERALGKRLQLARRRAGLTQQELCQKAGISYSTLAKIERGAIRSPSVFTVASIASITQTPVEDLLDVASGRLKSPAPLEAKKRSKTGVTFVYFDVNGVLVKFFNKAFTEIARAAGLSSDIVETLFWRHHDSLISGQITLDKFNQILGEEMGLKGFSWQKYYMENAEPMPETKELMDWAAAHYEVGLISNNAPGFIDELRQNKIIPDVKYAAVIDSSKVGLVKPEPRIYEIAQELAAVEPKEILFVDNERPNLIGADRAGWQVMWFDDLHPEEGIDRLKKALEF
jgi:putative hydrolase of the HAD superfamily